VGARAPGVRAPPGGREVRRAARAGGRAGRGELRHRGERRGSRGRGLPQARGQATRAARGARHGGGRVCGRAPALRRRGQPRPGRGGGPRRGGDRRVAGGERAELPAARGARRTHGEGLPPVAGAGRGLPVRRGRGRGRRRHGAGDLARGHDPEGGAAARRRGPVRRAGRGGEQRARVLGRLGRRRAHGGRLEGVREGRYEADQGVRSAHGTRSGPSRR
jgi:hypothetical protein